MTSAELLSPQDLDSLDAHVQDAAGVQIRAFLTAPS